MTVFPINMTIREMIILSLILGLFLWIVDAVIATFVFHEGTLPIPQLKTYLAEHGIVEFIKALLELGEPCVHLAYLRFCPLFPFHYLAYASGEVLPFLLDYGFRDLFNLVERDQVSLRL